MTTCVSYKIRTRENMAALGRSNRSNSNTEEQQIDLLNRSSLA